MRVSELAPGDPLDLENLNLPGADGLVAQDECAAVEKFDVVFSILYTDQRNISVPGTAEIEASPAGGYRFKNPDDVTRTWTW